MNSLLQNSIDSFSPEDIKKIEDAMTPADKNFIVRIKIKKENKDMSETGRFSKLTFRV